MKIKSNQVQASLSESAYSVLKHEIMENALSPGYQEMESELALRLGMSRTPVREAAIRLSKEGLVEIIPRKGIRVKPVSVNDMKEIYDQTGIKVFGVSADDFDSHQNFIDKFGLNFELIIDENHEICHKYGVLYEKNDNGNSKLSIKRITYLLDENGIIMKIWKNVDPNGHAQEIINFIETSKKS